MDTAPVPADRGSALVTGAGGFIGSHLSLHLAASGYRVRALDIDLSRWGQLGGLRGVELVELVEGDVADHEVQRTSLRGIKTVFNLAAAHLGASVAEQEYRRVNVDCLRMLAEECLQAGVERVVHCSSVGVYGRLEQTPADEDTPCRPEFAYERTKLDGEAVLREAIEERGLRAVILRPVWVYGPGCGRTEKLFRAIGKGRFVVAGSGRSWRHCIYIEDMVSALLLAATREAAVGKTLIVGDTEPVTVRQLVDSVARILGVRRPLSVPLLPLEMAALVVEYAYRFFGLEPPLSRRSLRFFTGNTAFSTHRARRALGFEPKYDLVSGLAETHEALTAGRAWPITREALSPGEDTAQSHLGSAGSDS